MVAKQQTVAFWVAAHASSSPPFLSTNIRPALGHNSPTAQQSIVRSEKMDMCLPSHTAQPYATAAPSGEQTECSYGCWLTTPISTDTGLPGPYASSLSTLHLGYNSQKEAAWTDTWPWSL